MGEDSTASPIEGSKEEQQDLYLRKLETLEAAVQDNYDKITRRILVLESIILKQFGSNAIVRAEKIVPLLDKNMMKLQSQTLSRRRGRPPKKQIAVLSTPVNQVSNVEINSRTTTHPKIEFEDNSTISKEGGQKIVVNEVQGESSEIVADYIVHDDVDGDDEDGKNVIVTRSGRRSIPNRKFDWDVKEERVAEENFEEAEGWENEEEGTKDLNEASPTEGIHMCDQCGKILSTSSNLRAHRRRCHISSRQWKFACSYCDQKFPTEFKRDYHTKIHIEDRPHKCEVTGCEAAFKFKTQLIVHHRVHQSSRRFSCTACGRSYKHKSGLNLHMLTHKQMRLYGCPISICDRKFYTRTHVKRHLRQFHKNENEELEIPKDDSQDEPRPPKKPKLARPRKPITERIICDQCGTSVLKNNFKHHLGTHEILFSCDQCGKGFSTEFGLKSHIEHAHDLDKPYMCNYPDCESRFNSISNLRTHQVSHTEERRFRCEPCNKSYKHNGGLKVHINACHSKEKQFPCTMCSMVFDTRTHLKRHIIKVHNIDKDDAEEMTKLEKKPKEKIRVICDLCSKSYKNKHDLHLHKNAAHTHEIKFPCDRCPKVFYRKNHLKRHLQKVHNVEPIDDSDMYQPKMDLDLATVEVIEEIPSSSGGVYKTYQLQPGTVVEILDFDVHHTEEIS